MKSLQRSPRMAAKVEGGLSNEQERALERAVDGILYLAADTDPNAADEYDLVRTHFPDVIFVRPESWEHLRRCMLVPTRMTVLTGHGNGDNGRDGSRADRWMFYLNHEPKTPSSMMRGERVAAANLVITACDQSWRRSDTATDGAAVGAWEPVLTGPAAVAQGELTYPASRRFVTELFARALQDFPSSGLEFVEQIRSSRRAAASQAKTLQPNIGRTTFRFILPV